MRAYPFVLASLSAMLVVSTSIATKQGAPDPRDQALLAACGEGDATLADVAGKLARDRLAGTPLPMSDELADELRAAGETHPWPRMLAFRDQPIDREATLARVRRWSHELAKEAPQRCGIANATDEHGQESMVVIAVPALADMTPLPTSVRRGAWVTVDATLHQAAEDARVIVLGPRGAPRTIPSSVRDGRLLARFSADHPGRWLVQVIADAGAGPRPVVEGFVRAGGSDATETTVPGDEVEESTPEATLDAMISAARASEGLPTLTRSPALDRLARAHAEHMAKAGRLAHDLGDGDPVARVQNAGLSADDVGENVAHAGTISHAHRVIWASPSHRENLLSPRWQEEGVGVARGADGSSWVVELFLR